MRKVTRSQEFYPESNYKFQLTVKDTTKVNPMCFDLQLNSGSALIMGLRFRYYSSLPGNHTNMCVSLLLQAALT